MLGSCTLRGRTTTVDGGRQETSLIVVPSTRARQVLTALTRPRHPSALQSKASRRLTYTGCGSLRHPGFGGKVEGQTTGELRRPGLQLLKRNGWDSRSGGAADCSCEVCGQEGEQARKDAADGRARDCRVKGHTRSKKTTAVYQCGVGSRRSEDAIQRNVEGSGEE